MKATIRNLFIRSAAPAVAAMALVASAPDAEAAAYIKFDGVDGEALDRDHKAWSDLLSFGQAIHRPGGGATGATRRRGDVVLDDIVCTKELDKASPKIAEAICKGRVFPTVWIELTKDVVGDDGTIGEATYLRYELKNVFITSYSVSGAAGRSPDPAGGVQVEPVPVDQVSLNFEEIRVTYTEFDKASGKKKGNVEYSWKVEEGEG